MFVELHLRSVTESETHIQGGQAGKMTDFSAAARHAEWMRRATIAFYLFTHFALGVV